jgi:hypothetical protein
MLLRLKVWRYIFLEEMICECFTLIESFLSRSFLVLIHSLKVISAATYAITTIPDAAINRLGSCDIPVTMTTFFTNLPTLTNEVNNYHGWLCMNGRFQHNKRYTYLTTDIIFIILGYLFVYRHLFKSFGFI